jgi:hypothetical protein
MNDSSKLLQNIELLKLSLDNIAKEITILISANNGIKFKLFKRLLHCRYSLHKKGDVLNIKSRAKDYINSFEHYIIISMSIE